MTNTKNEKLDKLEQLEQSVSKVKSLPMLLKASEVEKSVDIVVELFKLIIKGEENAN